MRFLTCKSVHEKRSHICQNYIKSLQGWGFLSPVWDCLWKLLFKLLVTFFTRISFLSRLSIFMKKLPKLLVTLCSRMRFNNSKFVHEISSYPSLPVSLLMKKDYLNFLSHSLQGWGFLPLYVCSWKKIAKTSSHTLFKDEVPHL